MGILNYIQKKKTEHRFMKTSSQVQKLQMEKKRLEAERIREGALAKSVGERMTVERDVQKLKDYNERNTPPSALKRFGTGLKSVIDKQRSKGQAKSPKVKKGKGRSFRVSAPQSSGSSGLNNAPQGSIFGGQRNLDVGGGGTSPFNSGGRDIFGTRPSPVVQEKPKVKSKTIIRY